MEPSGRYRDIMRRFQSLVTRLVISLKPTNHIHFNAPFFKKEINENNIKKKEKIQINLSKT